MIYHLTFKTRTSHKAMTTGDQATHCLQPSGHMLADSRPHNTNTLHCEIFFELVLWDDNVIDFIFI